jgi:hypothetical protein
MMHITRKTVLRCTTKKNNFVFIMTQVIKDSQNEIPSIISNQFNLSKKLSIYSRFQVIFYKIYLEIITGVIIGVIILLIQKQCF